MADLKLGKLPDRTPVKLTRSLPADLNQALHDHARGVRRDMRQGREHHRLDPRDASSMKDALRPLKRGRFHSRGGPLRGRKMRPGRSTSRAEIRNTEPSAAGLFSGTVRSAIRRRHHFASRMIRPPGLAAPLSGGAAMAQPERYDLAVEERQKILPRQRSLEPESLTRRAPQFHDQRQKLAALVMLGHGRNPEALAKADHRAQQALSVGA